MELKSSPELPRYDYVSPGLAIVRPDAAFPQMIAGGTRTPQWRWLRRWVEHNWYTDRRNPDAGFLDRDEAAILYNAARLVHGKPCLEIGCWRGWSTVHIALGSGMLDVVDPIVANPDFAESLRQSCTTAHVFDSITFHEGYSPGAVEALAHSSGKKWSLIFVDGDHEGDAPQLDAEAAVHHAADTAMVMFHDLASPYVAAGLDVMRNAGWRTMLYQTMQIMGVAWRGNIEPPEHTPDPRIFWTLPAHLAGYHVCNWDRPTIRADGGWWPGMTMEDRRDAAMMRAQAAEDNLLAAEDRAQAMEARAQAAEAQAQAAEARAQAAKKEAHTLRVNVNEFRDQLAQWNIRMADRAEQLAVQGTEIAQREAQIASLSVQLMAQHAKVARSDVLVAYLNTELTALQTDAAYRDARIAYFSGQLADFGGRVTEQQAELATQHIVRFLIERRVLLSLLRRSAKVRIEILRSRAASVKIDLPLPDELFHTLLRRRMLFGLVRRTRVAREVILTRIARGILENTREICLQRLLFRLEHDASVPPKAGESLKSVREASLVRLSELEREVDAAQNAAEALRRTQELISQDFLQAPWPASSDGLSLGSHLLSNGWGRKAARFPGFLGTLIGRCFADSQLGEDGELAWVKRVVSGYHLPSNGASLLAAAARVRNSGLFDTSFYRRQAGISGRSMDPATHYVLVGDALGVQPSQFFDSAYYGDRYPDVVAAGINRLLHYLSNGRSEGRHALPPDTYRLGDRPIDPLREDVILVVHETSRTGAPVLGWNIASRLAARYNLFTIALGDGPLTEDFRAVSVEMYGPFAPDRRHPIDIEYGLRRLLDSRPFKYAIINSCESRFVIESCANRLIPTVMLMHEFASYVTADSLRRAFDRASEIVFPAETVARSSLDMHPPLRERPMRILPQGVCILPGRQTGKSIEISPSLDALARARKEGAFIVLGAGSVNLRKGVDVFLATAMVVRRQAGDRVRFVWVGGGYKPQEDLAYSVYLHEQLQRSGLQDYVTFLGEVSDLETIYSLADVLFLSSRLDPMPNVSIDASHRGIPVICFEHASGVAELLKSDPEAAFGVVKYLDSNAAGQVILSLAADRDRWRRMAAATRKLARSTLDMEKYVDSIDVIGSASSVNAKRQQDDADLLCRTDDVDQDIYLGSEPIFESRFQTVRRAVSLSVMRANSGVRRRSSPGFNPLVWRSERLEPTSGDPLADFVRSGRPKGPWSMQVLRPPEDPSKLEAPRIRAVLHVHLTDTNRAADLLMRVQTNRLRFDLLVSTDSILKVGVLREALRSFDRGSLHVAMVEVGEQPLRWLLSELRLPVWSGHDVVGHLHHGSDTDDAFIDFQWTALLGGRHPMLDRVLNAFALQPMLGLVFPCDPLLPSPDVIYDYPSGGMFWVRRATLDRLQVDAAEYFKVLPQACVAVGLNQAVTHVPGVFR